MDPPEWLNEKFLCASLEADEGSVNVIEFKCSPAVTKGNNNFSSLFRVSVTFSKEEDCSILKSVSLIVKAPVAGVFMKDLAEKMKVVEKEVLVYKELMPAMHRTLENVTFTPRSHHSARDDVIVLEDLNEKGYRMCNRLEQLDRDHCVNVMTTLAKFHATSVALHEKNPELIEEVGRKFVFTDDIAQENREQFSAIFEKNLICTARAVNTFEGYQHFSEKILQQVDTLWDRMVIMSSKKKHVKVLNHGDLWTNNILFKYDELGKVVDVKLIDLQLCKYSTPGVDIQTFLASSAEAKVRENAYCDLVNTYRETFNSTLRKLNCNVRLSAEELEEEIRFADIHGFFVVCSLVPVVLAEHKSPQKPSEKRKILETLDPNITAFADVYYGECFKKALINQLEMLEAKGFFR